MQRAVLANPPSDGYRRELPTPEDIQLLIEVAESSLGFDRGVKLPLYARAGIPEVWIVDLPGEAIERYSDRHDGVYRKMDQATRGQSLASLSIPSLVLDVDAVLG